MRMQIVIAAAAGAVIASLASFFTFLFLHHTTGAPSAPAAQQPIELARASCEAATETDYAALKGLTPHDACGCLLSGYDKLDFANQTYALSIYQRAEANAPTDPQQRIAYDRTLLQRMKSIVQQDGYAMSGPALNFAEALRALRPNAFTPACATFLFR